MSFTGGRTGEKRGKGGRNQVAELGGAEAEGDEGSDAVRVVVGGGTVAGAVAGAVTAAVVPAVAATVAAAVARSRAAKRKAS